MIQHCRKCRIYVYRMKYSYACFKSRSWREKRLFRRAAVFLCIVLVQETLSISEQKLLNSVSANETSFAVIASKKDFDCALMRFFRQWFTARRLAFCRTSFLADRDCGTVVSPSFSTCSNRGANMALSQNPIGSQVTYGTLM